MISGMLTPGPEAEFAYPSSLKPELFAAIGDYVPDIDLPKYEAESHQDALSFMNVVSHAFLQREKAFFYLMDHKPWDFFMGVFILAERLQHFFWKYMDPDCGLYGSAMANRLRGNITDCYRLMDDFLGRLLDRLTPDTLLLIMSDHGFGPTDAWFNVSAWLEAQGLLRMRKEVASRKKLLYKLVSLNDVKWVRSLVPGFIQSRMRKRARRGRSAFVTDLLSEHPVPGDLYQRPARGIRGRAATRPWTGTGRGPSFRASRPRGSISTSGARDSGSCRPAMRTRPFAGKSRGAWRTFGMRKPESVWWIGSSSARRGRERAAANPRGSVSFVRTSARARGAGG